MYTKLRNQSGKISNFEMILIICIVVMGLFLGYKGVQWCMEEMHRGNDAYLVNTADSEARINSNNGINCVVHDCASDNHGICTHQLSSNGGTVGYLDKVTKHIVGEKPYGYNESQVMTIGNETFYGDVNTMVIRVEALDGEIRVSWVPGRN